MNIALASDHAGFDLKVGIAHHLAEKGVTFEDFGCGPGESVDYVDFAVKALDRVLAGAFDRAILFCGTGMGMAIVANKFRGIRATPCWTTYTAEMSRKHNDANCLTLGGRVLSLDEARAIVDVWLAAPFEGGRHAGRVNKIKALEDRHFRS